MAKGKDGEIRGGRGLDRGFKVTKRRDKKPKIRRSESRRLSRMASDKHKGSNSNTSHGYGSKAGLPTGKTVLLTPHTMALYTTVAPHVPIAIATHAYLFQHDDAQC